MADLCTFRTLASVIETGHDGETKSLEDALDAALTEVSAACVNANAKSSLTLVIRAEPTGAGQLKMSAQITTKVPQPGAIPVRLFLDKEGRLTASDPDQPALPDDITAPWRKKEKETPNAA